MGPLFFSAIFGREQSNSFQKESNDLLNYNACKEMSYNYWSFDSFKLLYCFVQLIYRSKLMILNRNK